MELIESFTAYSSTVSRQLIQKKETFALVGRFAEYCLALSDVICGQEFYVNTAFDL